MSRSEEFANGHGYRGNHRPPEPDDEVGMPMHDLTRNLPEDVYDKPHYYTAADDSELRQQLRKARGNPDANIRVYRALPKPHRDINPGDWVTTSRAYAQQHARSEPGSNHVVVGWTPAKNLWTHGDDLQEWGYHGPETKRGEVIWRDRRKKAE